MTPEAIALAQRLLALLSGKKPKRADIDRIAAGAASFEDFRVRLVLSGALGEAGTEVMRRWQDRVSARRAAPVASDLLHTLEHLSSRQRDLERQLQEQDGAIRAKLIAIDTITGQLAELQRQSHKVGRLVAHYRAAIVRLSGRDAGDA